MAQYDPSLSMFELFSRLEKRFRPPAFPSARPSDQNTMQIAALEATASSGGKKNEKEQMR